MTKTAADRDSGVRLDVFVASMLDISRSGAQRIIDDGAVSVNGSPEDKNYRVCPGDIIAASAPSPQLIEALPQNIPIDIVYEDDELIVVNKPQGMVVHPAPGNPDGTLVNALLYHCGGRLSSINGKIRPGIVHRIDKDTSGLLIVAKTDRAHAGLAAQIETHSFVRRYDAVLIGCPREDEGRIDAPIGRHPTDRKKMAVTDRNSKRAVTDYRIIEHFSGYSLAECTLHTGRTHQIRVHMSYIGHPVLGDPVYRPDPARAERFALKGQCLNAKYIEFVHPVTGRTLSFTSPVPQYFAHVLSMLRGGR